MFAWLHQYSYYELISQYQPTGNGILLRYNPERILSEWIYIDVFPVSFMFENSYKSLIKFHIYGNSDPEEIKMAIKESSIGDILYTDDKYYAFIITGEYSKKVLFTKVGDRCKILQFHKRFITLMNILSSKGWIIHMPMMDGHDSIGYFLKRNINSK